MCGIVYCINMRVSDCSGRCIDVDQSNIEEDVIKKLEMLWVMAVGGGEVYLLVKK